ncbi:MAG: radical SAM protein [Planctomycetota bacterium]|nr:radical SAM protein [Planctomycetota bacterium]
MAIKLRNEAGERCATLDFQRVDGRPKLNDLWFLWSVCNLECTHCYVGSSPRNQTLEMMGLDEIHPFLEEGVRFGMDHIYYTGGEPFVHREIVPIIEASLGYAPVTILTNATRPIERHWDALERIQRQQADRLTFRVSLDHYDSSKHDLIRGEGNFGRTVSNASRLMELGYRVIITSTPVVFEENPVTLEEAVDAYKALFDSQRGHRPEIKVLPSTLAMGAEIERRGGAPIPAFLTEQVFRKANPAAFQCHTARAVQKIGGRMRVYPCPIIYNDSDFDLGSTLEESFEQIYLAHPACYSFCYRGGSCTDETNTF